MATVAVVVFVLTGASAPRTAVLAAAAVLLLRQAVVYTPRAYRAMRADPH